MAETHQLHLWILNIISHKMTRFFSVLSKNWTMFYLPLKHLASDLPQQKHNNPVYSLLELFPHMKLSAIFKLLLVQFSHMTFSYISHIYDHQRGKIMAMNTKPHECRCQEKRLSLDLIHIRSFLEISS